MSIKQYNIIYADPPWEYRTYSKKGKGRSAENHYPTMSIEQIKSLPVSELAAPDCSLFMVEDLLTMAELIDMVSDMRTKDVRVIGELGKYVPTFAAFEKGRLSLYREAAKEAEEIMQRWDDDFEPDEYFAD